MEDESIFRKLEEMPIEKKLDSTREYIKTVQRVMNKGISDARKEALLFQLNETYNNIKNKYYSNNNINLPTIFDYPQNYFRIVERGLYFQNNNKVDFISDTVKGFLMLDLPHTVDYKIEFELINALYDLLIHFPKTHKNYSSIIDDYIFKYQPSCRLDLLTFPKNFFMFYDNNLWYKNYGMSILNDNLPSLLLVYGDFPKNIFKFYGLPIPNRSTLKQIFKYMKKEFINILDKYDNNHASIVYHCKNTFYNTKYNIDIKRYICSDIIIKSPYLIRKSTNINNKINKAFVPDYAATVMYYLSAGDIHILNSLALLITDILLENNLSKKLHIIVSSSKNLNQIKNFIDTMIRV